MTNKLWIAGLLAFACAGCSVGMAPEPMNDSQLKDAVSKMPPQDQINYINSSPMPPAMKAQRIADIKAKAGMK